MPLGLPSVGERPHRGRQAFIRFVLLYVLIHRSITDLKAFLDISSGYGDGSRRFSMNSPTGASSTALNAPGR